MTIITPSPTPGEFPPTPYHVCVYVAPQIAVWNDPNDGEWGALSAVPLEPGAKPWIYACRCGEKVDLRGMFPDD